MALLSKIVNNLGGMAQKQQLVRRGADDRDLTYAVRAGDVVRVRNGWYSTMDERSPELRAVRVGGRLTGISAIIARGGWVLGKHPLHVAVNENAGRLRTQHNRYKRLNVEAPGGVVLHWSSREQAERGTAVLVGLLDALERVVLDEQFEVAVAALDWALHTRQIDTVDLETLILRLPVERGGIRDWVDEACESLPESLARTRLRLAGYRVESQVPLGDFQRIDLLVDRQIAIEVDGNQHHLTRFEYDRGKDVAITLDHKHALRPSANMVFNDWDQFALAVETALLDRGVICENSGFPRLDPMRIRALRGFRRRPPRRMPEFTTWREGQGPGRGGSGSGGGGGGGTGGGEGNGNREAG
jgi:very-short-patch-repair endonuclease